MGASTGIFGRSEVAVMVAVVLLTTLFTPLALRATYQMKSRQDAEEGLDILPSVLEVVEPDPVRTARATEPINSEITYLNR
jgi:hypothetical protein